MSEEKKKVSLQELVQQRLKDKKQTHADNNSIGKPAQTLGKKSQTMKKTTASHRKMGV